MSADDGFVWEDPPAPNFTGRPSGRRDAMRANPGRWMLFGVYASQGGTAIRRAGFEVATRKREDGRFDVYARWPEDAA